MAKDTTGSSCSATAIGDGKPSATKTEADHVDHADAPPPPADRCQLIPSSAAAVAYAAPHIVVSQILRPEVAAFLPTDEERWCATIRDRHRFVTAVKVAEACDIIAVLEYAAQFPFVESLSLPGCYVDQKVIHAIHSDFPNVTDLDLSHAYITGVVAPELPLLTTLRSLRLRDVSDVSVPRGEPGEVDEYIYGGTTAYRVPGSEILDFALMPSLEVLDLRGCALDNEAFTALTELRSLTQLCIDFDDSSGRHYPGLPDFSLLANLDTLKIRIVSGLAAVVLPHFSGLRKLRQFDLCCTDPAATALKTIAQFKNLESLTLSDASPVDVEAIEAISALPRLRTLVLRSCNIDSSAARLPCFGTLSSCSSSNDGM